MEEQLRHNLTYWINLKVIGSYKYQALELSDIINIRGIWDSTLLPTLNICGQSLNCLQLEAGSLGWRSGTMFGPGGTKNLDG